MRKGFSLIELMIAISLLLLIIGLTGLSFSRYLEKKEFENISRQFIADMELARDMAIRNQYGKSKVVLSSLSDAGEGYKIEDEGYNQTIIVRNFQGNIRFEPAFRFVYSNSGSILIDPGKPLPGEDGNILLVLTDGSRECDFNISPNLGIIQQEQSR
ncbi:MAG: prepilin-type N-terminal cleavage/methylation domain-containing protein [Candidatus Eremiobacteraeota bacterium]|nr:prepilin-type N-terminal cleavage/methylation domain-containing protein [Candidatus Eremiobacteraeota bacterium]